MRVLMVTETFHPIVGGSQTAIRYLSDALSDLGHETMVAVMNVRNSTSPSDKISFAKFDSYIFGIDCKMWGKIHNCRKIIRKFKPDIVNAHFLFESGFVGTIAAHKEGIPSVVSIRGRGIFFKPKNLLEKLLSWWWIRGACKADGFIATSQEMADIAHARHGLTVTAVSNGVETDVFTPDMKKDIKTPYGISSSQRVIFCARRLVPKNGIEYVIRALPEVRKHHDAVLLLAAPKDAEYNALNALVDELNIRPFVHFIGSVDHYELPYYFAGADIVVQPSIAEARSLACLEAMAAGAAIIATACGGLKELITHGENGYLVPVFEESTYQVGILNHKGVFDLAQAMITVLSDPELEKKLRRHARSYAETCSWPAIAEQSLAIYRNAMDHYSSSR